MNRQIRWAVGVFLIATASVPAFACDQAEGTPVIRLQVFSPLTMLQHGAATDISVDATGCVTARYPTIDKRSGTHRYQLEADEFAALERDVQSAGLSSFDAAHIRRALEQSRPKREGEIEYFTADADIVELTLAPGMADAKSRSGKSIRWQGIESALMNRPDVTQLQSLAVVKARLMHLGSDRRMTKEGAP